MTANKYFVRFAYSELILHFIRFGLCIQIKIIYNNVYNNNNNVYIPYIYTQILINIAIHLSFIHMNMQKNHST